MALLATRMYTGWHTLWPGIAKNLVDMLGGPWPTIFTAAAAVLLAWAVVLVPAIDIVLCANGSDVNSKSAGPRQSRSASE